MPIVELYMTEPMRSMSSTSRFAAAGETAGMAHVKGNLLLVGICALLAMGTFANAQGACQLA